MKLFNKVAVLGILALIAAACNTVEGVGEDVQAGGRAVENSAQDVQRKM